MNTNELINSLIGGPWTALDLDNPDDRAKGYGMILAARLHSAAASTAQLQLTRYAYPGQASTRAQHVVAPCCCWYWTEAYGLRLSITDPLTAWRYRVLSADCSGFDINPACPHHGHRANTHLIERLWEDPYSNGLLRDPYDMDDDERRG